MLAIIVPLQSYRLKTKALCGIAGSYLVGARLIASQTQRLLSLDTITAI